MLQFFQLAHARLQLAYGPAETARNNAIHSN